MIYSKSSSEDIDALAAYANYKKISYGELVAGTTPEEQCKIITVWWAGRKQRKKEEKEAERKRIAQRALELEQEKQERQGRPRKTPEEIQREEEEKAARKKERDHQSYLRKKEKKAERKRQKRAEKHREIFRNPPPKGTRDGWRIYTIAIKEADDEDNRWRIMQLADEAAAAGDETGAELLRMAASGMSDTQIAAEKNITEQQLGRVKDCRRLVGQRLQTWQDPFGVWSPGAGWDTTPRKGRFTPEEEEKALRLYNEGREDWEIAHEMNVEYHRVQTWRYYRKLTRNTGKDV